MHDHGGGGDHAGVWLNLLPFWLQVAFVVLLCAVTAWAVLETAVLRGTVRLAAGLHVLIGVGMLDMFAPWVGDTGRARFWQITFAAAAVLALTGVAVAAARAREFVGLWALTALDSAAMAYMFLLFDAGYAPFTYLLAGLYALLTLAWVHGALDVTHRPMCAGWPATSGPLPARVTRAAQAGMAASMAWMFLIMAPHSGGFFGRAFTVGLTEDTWWAVAVIGLLLRVAFDPPLVRRIVAVPASQTGVPRPRTRSKDWGYARRRSASRMR